MPPCVLCLKNFVVGKLWGGRPASATLQQQTPASRSRAHPEAAECPFQWFFSCIFYVSPEFPRGEHALNPL